MDSESFTVCTFVQKVVDLDEMFSQPVTQKRADMLFTIEQQSDLFSPLVPILTEGINQLKFVFPQYAQLIKIFLLFARLH